MSLISSFSLETDLLTRDFQHMYVQWGQSTPPRTGIHASAILAKESEFCTREHVLHALFPTEQGEREPAHSWDWKRSMIFENGWRLHQRWQAVFKKFGNVVMTDGEPELDLTHYDPERNLYFSPDAILRFGGEKYVVEIKGIKQESYQELSDDLEQSAQACETIHKAREQCNLYMHLTGIERGIILAENKNTCDFRLWVFAYEQERAWAYTERLERIKAAVTLSRVHGPVKWPARRCSAATDKRARACPMRAVCFSEQKKGHQS